MKNEVDTVIGEIMQEGPPFESGRMRFVSLVRQSNCKDVSQLVGALGYYLFANGGTKKVESVFSCTDLSVTDATASAIHKIVDLMAALSLDQAVTMSMISSVSGQAQQEIIAVIRNFYPERIGKS